MLFKTSFMLLSYIHSEMFTYYNMLIHEHSITDTEQMLEVTVEERFHLHVLHFHTISEIPQHHKNLILTV